MDTPERRDQDPTTPSTSARTSGGAASGPARPGSPALTRRHALGGVAAAAAAFPLLAACGGDSSSTSGSDDAAGDKKADDKKKSSPADKKKSGDDAAKGGDSGADLGTTAEIPVDGGKVFAAQKVVVTQPKKGTFKAFSSTCTHMGCTVAKVSDGMIHCPCHGSVFSAADGSVKHGPAKKPLQPMKIEVEGGSFKLT